MTIAHCIRLSRDLDLDSTAKAGSRIRIAHSCPCLLSSPAAQSIIQARFHNKWNPPPIYSRGGVCGRMSAANAAGCRQTATCPVRSLDIHKTVKDRAYLAGTVVIATMSGFVPVAKPDDTSGSSIMYALSLRFLVRFAAVAFVSTALSGLQAGPLRAELLVHHDLSYAAALAIAREAVENCAAKGYGVSAVVVDRDGETIVAIRGDNASPHTSENARRKAYTAMSFRTSTTDYAQTLRRQQSGGASAGDVAKRDRHPWRTADQGGRGDCRRRWRLGLARPG